MDTFGDKLRSEREVRGLTIQTVARRLGVDDERLRALERNDFRLLPDNDTMLGCLRSYAECLEVDAELMIEDYLSERERCVAELDRTVTSRRAESELVAATPRSAEDDVVAATALPAEGVVGATARPAESAVPPTMPSALSRRPTFPRGIVIVAVAAIGLVGAWWMLSGDPAPSMQEPGVVGTSSTTQDRTDPHAPSMQRPTGGQTPTAQDRTVARAPSTQQPTGARAAGETPSATPTETTEPPVTGTPPRSVESTIPAAAGVSGLSVSDHGVGTAVERRRLVGRGERFREGTQVWYWTRVEGGQVGDRIEHVWLRDGIEAGRTSLKIGGSSWRTYSAKTLHVGSVGEWIVESRDADGRVLSRREFDCVR